MAAWSRLHLEPVGGVAGDMLLGALLDLGADVAQVRAALASFGEPGLVLELAQVEVGAERACHVRSLVGLPTRPAPGSLVRPVSAKAHAHHDLAEILARIEQASLTPSTRARAKEIFSRLAEAEAEVHGGTAATVHLHEVAELDSIMDVVGICVALETLGAPYLTCAPLPSGRGTVRTSHGVLSCPVPAVQSIARRCAVPLVDAPLEGETVTPTGIAAVAVLCSDFAQVDTSAAERRGAGAGTRRFANRPNVLRVYAW